MVSEPEKKKDIKLWVYVPEWKLAIISSPKCANRSLLYTIVSNYYPDVTYETVSPKHYRNQTKYYQYMNKDFVKPEWNKLAIIRDPVDRFVSLWAHHCRDGVCGIPKELRENTSMDKLINFIEQNINSDPHWASQNYIIGEHENINYCCIEDVDKELFKMTNGKAPKLERVNVTKNKKDIKVPEHIKNKIREIYSDDYLLLEKTVKHS